MRRALVAYPLIGLVVLSLWFFTAYVPHHREKKVTGQGIAEAEKQLADFQQTIAELPRIIKERKNLLSLRDDLDSKLYTKEDVLKLFDELDRQATRWEIELIEITPPVEELLYLNTIVPDSGQPQFLNIGLRLDGDYLRFGRFIETIEQADYFRGINRCKMQGHADDNTKITLHLGFKALLGSLKEET